MFLDKDDFKRTAWLMTAEEGQIQVLHKLWEWAEKVLTQEELNNMFLDKEEFKRPPGSWLQGRAI